MSSAANHRKRSHRSEVAKRGALAAQSRRAYYNPANGKKSGFFGGLFGRAKKQAPARGARKREATGSNDNV